MGFISVLPFSVSRDPHTFAWHIVRVDDDMSNMTLSIPEDPHKKMRKHTELKWNDIARQAFEMKLGEIELFGKLPANSELTEEDA